MADEAKGVSDEGVEERSYTQIKEARESSNAQTDSTAPATQAPVPGAPQAPQPAPSQPVVPTFKTLEEAQAHAIALQKQLDDSQSQIGKQGNEMGELRNIVANLQGKVEAGIKPAPPEDDFDKTYVERFKDNPALEGMSDGNRKVLGIMFDGLKADLKEGLKRSAGGGELVGKLNDRIQQLENQQIKQGWDNEGLLLQQQYGKVYTDNAAAVTADMQKQIAAGQLPSVTETFKRLTYDQVRGEPQQQQPTDAKAILNNEASLQPNTAPQARPAAPVTNSSMTSAEKLKAIVADRKARGLPL